jgi:hypothetical protein
VNGSRHIVKQVEGNCSRSSSYPPSTLRRNGSQWRQSVSLMIPQKKEKSHRSKARRTAWPSDKPAPANLFLFKLEIKKCGDAPLCWYSMPSGPSSSISTRNSFNIPNYSMQATVLSAKKERPDRPPIAYDSRMFGYFTRIVASPSSQIVSINILW